VEMKNCTSGKIENCGTHAEGVVWGTTINQQKQSTIATCCINKKQEKLHNQEGSKQETIKATINGESMHSKMNLNIDTFTCALFVES